MQRQAAADAVPDALLNANAGLRLAAFCQNVAAKPIKLLPTARFGVLDGHASRLPAIWASPRAQQER